MSDSIASIITFITIIIASGLMVANLSSANFLLIKGTSTDELQDVSSTEFIIETIQNDAESDPNELTIYAKNIGKRVISYDDLLFFVSNEQITNAVIEEMNDTKKSQPLFWETGESIQITSKGAVASGTRDIEIQTVEGIQARRTFFFDTNTSYNASTITYPEGTCSLSLSGVTSAREYDTKTYTSALSWSDARFSNELIHQVFRDGAEQCNTIYGNVTGSVNEPCDITFTDPGNITVLARGDFVTDGVKCSDSITVDVAPAPPASCTLNYTSGPSSLTVNQTGQFTSFVNWSNAYPDEDLTVTYYQNGTSVCDQLYSGTINGSSTSSCEHNFTTTGNKTLTVEGFFATSGVLCSDNYSVEVTPQPEASCQVQFLSGPTSREVNTTGNYTINTSWLNADVGGEYNITFIQDGTAICTDTYPGIVNGTRQESCIHNFTTVENETLTVEGSFSQAGTLCSDTYTVEVFAPATAQCSIQFTGGPTQKTVNTTGNYTANVSWQEASVSDAFSLEFLQNGSVVCQENYVTQSGSVSEESCIYNLTTLGNRTLTVQGVFDTSGVLCSDNYTVEVTKPAGTVPRLYCWGDGSQGQIDTGDSNQYLTPTRTVTNDSFSSVTAGTFHTCIINNSNVAKCTGADFNGRLGNAGGSTQTLEIVTGGYSWTDISAGDTSTCGVTTTGVGYCWGRGGSGQIGDGLFSNQGSPSAVSGGYTWKEISVGKDAACGVTTSNKGYCWGSGQYGKTGIGNTSNMGVPTAVLGNYSFQRIAMGIGGFACGLLTNNSVRCWGRNNLGQLGTGNNTDSLTPVPLAFNQPVNNVTSGRYHGCILNSTSHAYCWGVGNNGRLGTNDESSSNTPVAVSGGHTYTHLETVFEHTCGVLSNMSTVCWGGNDGGAVGDNTTIDVLAPKLIHGDFDAVTIAPGAEITCGVYEEPI